MAISVSIVMTNAPSLILDYIFLVAIWKGRLNMMVRNSTNEWRVQEQRQFDCLLMRCVSRNASWAFCFCPGWELGHYRTRPERSTPTSEATTGTSVSKRTTLWQINSLVDGELKRKGALQLAFNVQTYFFPSVRAFSFQLVSYSGGGFNMYITSGKSSNDHWAWPGWKGVMLWRSFVRFATTRSIPIFFLRKNMLIRYHTKSRWYFRFDCQILCILELICLTSQKLNAGVMECPEADQVLLQIGRFPVTIDDILAC